VSGDQWPPNFSLYKGDNVLLLDTTTWEAQLGFQNFKTKRHVGTDRTVVEVRFDLY
jgi:hypothetical protein